MNGRRADTSQINVWSTIHDSIPESWATLIAINEPTIPSEETPTTQPARRSFAPGKTPGWQRRPRTDRVGRPRPFPSTTPTGPRPRDPKNPTNC